MLSIVYVSTVADPPLRDPEVAALLQQCRDDNARLGVTGLLLYKGDEFMQVIEGDDDLVKALYSTIEADSRHTDVRLLLSTPITRRQFARWSMGYQELSDESLREIPGYDGFLDVPRSSQATWADPTKAQWLLDWFRRRTA